MIVTLTPNPSLDRAFDLTSLALGEVNRAEATRVDAGGKGVNISRALAKHGVESVAVFPCGGPDGRLLVTELADHGVRARPVPIAGAIRSNITIVEKSGVTTKINAPGPVLAPLEINTLLGAVDEAVQGAQWLVGAGSLPAGVPEEFYIELARIAQKRGTKMALDTSGDALKSAVAAGGLALIKPNDDELAELLGAELVTVGDVVDGSRHLMAAGIDAVLVSLGAHGALLIQSDSFWWAGGDPLVPLSTVGAGDTTLAGFLATPGSGPDKLHTAVAWGRAAVLLPGSEAPQPQHIHRSAVRVIAEPHRTLALKEL